MQTAVAFLIFKRPEKTAQVFEAIRQARPPRLLVVADGPRPDRPDEPEQCAATRAILDRVDWDCQVQTRYAETNLGCKACVSQGLDWVFSQVEEAIILEDDCVPHPSFFRFCDEMLAYYRDDDRIASISGQNVQFGQRRTEASYYFSAFFQPWGWASWRRAWQHYDVNLSLWPEVRDGGWLHDILGDRRAVKYWTEHLEATYAGRIDTWDYGFLLTGWLRHSLHVVADVNLISNIGFGTEATHTVAQPEQSPYANMATLPMAFPLRHPAAMVRSWEADRFLQNTYYQPSLLTRGRNKLKRLLRRRPWPLPAAAGMPVLSRS